MSGLIYKQAAMDAVMELVEVRRGWNSDASGEIRGLDAAYCAIADLPFAPPEGKRGRWIFGNTMGHSWMKCSDCLVSQSGQTACFSYCPNCGAYMGGKQTMNRSARVQGWK